MKKTALTLICVLIFATSISARPRDYVPLGEEYPFKAETVEKTLLAVAAATHTKLRPEIPFPPIVISTTVPLSAIKHYIWYRIETNALNYFVYQRNTIILMPGSEIHNLAHELVHYIQFNYDLGGDITLLYYDPEPEATRIQKMFKEGGIYAP